MSPFCAPIVVLFEEDEDCSVSRFSPVDVDGLLDEEAET